MWINCSWRHLNGEGQDVLRAHTKARVRRTEWPVNWRYGNELGGSLGVLRDQVRNHGQLRVSL